MGQYRQWLHYRDIDRHLQAQREKLTQEIAHLREQVQRIEASHPDAQNSIFLALVQQRTRQSMEQPIANAPHTLVSLNSFTGNGVPAEAMQHRPPMPPFLPLPPLPHRQDEPRPDEVNSNLDTQGQTDPQLTIPKWLYRAASQSGPLDPQSAQTNRLVQRWLERWGKQTPQSLQPSQLPTQTDQEQHQADSTASDTSLPPFSILHEDNHS